MVSFSYYKSNDGVIYFYISWWFYLHISLFKEMNKKLTSAWSWILIFFLGKIICTDVGELYWVGEKQYLFSWVLKKFVWGSVQQILRSS